MKIGQNERIRVETKKKFLLFLFLSLALFLLAFIPYSNSLRNGFVFDDVTIVKENNAIRSLRNIPEMSASDYWGEQSREGTGLYRPLTLLTFAINYHFSELHPFSYHLTNLLIHCMNSILLFFLFHLLFGSTRGAFLAAAIFAVHPVHTEAVTGIVGRAELLAFFFVFISLILFCSARSVRGSRIRAFLLFIGSLLSFFLALLSKETAIALPFILFFILIHKERRESGSNVLRTILRSRWELLAVFVVYVFYFLIRALVFGNPLGSSKPLMLDNPLAYLPFIQRWLGASFVFFKYLWLLVFPFHLSADYSYNQIPVESAKFSIIGSLSFLLLLSLIVFVVFLFKRRSDFFIPLAFYCSSMLVLSNLFILTGTIMAERLLYLPSAGFCIFLGILFSPDGGPLLKGVGRNRYFWLIFALITLFAIPRTLFRNHDWKNEENLFKKTVETSPMSAKAHNNLGNLLLDKGDLVGAERELRSALKIYPDYSVALSNLGTIFERKGLLGNAIQLYKKASRLDPEYAIAYSNLGNALYADGDLRGALTAYRQAIAISPHYSDAFYNLGTALALQGEYDGAVYHFRRALEIDPDYVQAENNLGMALKAAGRKREAEAAFLRALALSPSFHQPLFNLGKLYLEEGNADEAVFFLERARKEKRDHFGTLLFLGIAYMVKGDTDNAYEVLREAEILEKDNADLRRTLEDLMKMRAKREGPAP